MAETGARRWLRQKWDGTRREARALLELLLLPAVAALLPWRLGFAWLRWCARFERLYWRECEASLAVARHFVPIADEREWKRLHRLYRLVDHADYWLLLSGRGRGWLRRHVQVPPTWPPARTPVVGVFFHWSAGLWPVFALGDSGAASAVLAGRFTARTLGARVAGLYGRIRLAMLARVSGRPLVYAPGTLKRALADLAAGHSIVGTPDVPPEQTRLCAPITLFGRPALLPEGLAMIARGAGVPLVIFSCAIDPASGRRLLRASAPIDAGGEQLMQRIADAWQALMQEQSWAYGLWYALPAFFVPEQCGPAAVGGERIGTGPTAA